MLPAKLKKANKKMKIKLTALQEQDLHFVKEIYDYYTAKTTTVYFTEEVSIDTLKTFIPVGNPRYQSFIVKNEVNENIGFCYFSRYKAREAYDITVEITLYFKPGQTGKGYGSQLMSMLEPIIKESGFTNILSLIDSENKESIRLFEKFGYERCAHIKKVATKFGKYLDLFIYQKIIG